MGIYGFKPAFRRALRPVAARLGRVHPDAVSAAAIAISLAAGVLLWLAPQRPWLLLVVAPLLVARLAANALDGMLAQAQGVASPRGELVNELSDRVSDALILGGLALSGAVPTLLAGAALAVTLLVSYVGILEKAAGGIRNYAGPLGKADRMALLALACVAAVALPRQPVLEWTAWLFVALGLVTLLHRVRLAWGRLGAIA